MLRKRLSLCAAILLLTAVFAVGSFSVAADEIDATEISSAVSTEAVEPTESASVNIIEITKMENRINGIQLSWDSLGKDVSYKVYYRRAALYQGTWDEMYADTPWSLLATVNGTSFLDSAPQDAEIGSYLVCLASDAEPSAEVKGQEHCYYAAPEIRSLSSKESGVHLEWDLAWEQRGVRNGERYRVYRRTVKTSWKRITQGLTEGSYTDKTAVPGTEYIYTIRLTDDTDTYFISAYTSGKSIVYRTYPRLTGTECVSNGYKLSWNKYPGAAQYRVYYKSSNGWTRIAQVSGTSYTDTSIKINETRTYTIRALDAKGNFVSNYNQSGWKLRRYASPVIQSLSCADGGVKLTWKRADGADDYRVYRKTTGGWTRLAQTDASEYLDKTAVSGVKYTYTIRMISKANAFISYYNSGKSLNYVAAPAVTAFENTAKGVKVTWSKSAGASQYRLYHHTESGWMRIAQFSGTSYVDTSVLNGENRLYTVRCLDAKGNFVSDYHRSGYANTYFAPPVIKDITVSDDGVTLTWNRPQGAGDYRVYRRTAGASWARLVETSDTTFTDTTAVPGTQYIYTLRMVSRETGEFISAYLSGTMFTYQTGLTRAKWLYELITFSAAKPAVGENDASAVFRLAKQRGIIGAYSDSDITAPLTRLFAAQTLCKALGYTNHSIGTVGDSSDKAMSTVAYYGYFLPDENDCLYPDAELTSAEMSYLLSEMRLYQKLKGKTVISFGDSIMYGAGNNGQGPATILAQKYGMKYKDYSKPGATMGVESSHSHIADQVRKAIKDKCTPDLILLNGGTNDTWIGAIPLGNITTGFTVSSEADFSSGFETTMSLITKQWASVPVIYVRSHKMKLGSQENQIAYGTRAMTLASKWGAVTVDMYNESGFDATDRDVASRYTFDDDAYYRGIHPNALGYATYYLPMIKSVL